MIAICFLFKNKRWNPAHGLFDDSFKMLLNKRWISITSEWFQLLYSSASAHKTFKYNWMHLHNFWNINRHLIYWATHIVFDIQVNTSEMITVFDKKDKTTLWTDCCVVNHASTRHSMPLRTKPRQFYDPAISYFKQFFQTLQSFSSKLCPMLCIS